MLEESSRLHFHAREGVVSAARRWQTPRAYPACKRAFDLLCVLLLSPVAIIVITALALMVRLDGGRAFFVQQRIGKGGRIFRMWKLRTMVPDAEGHLRAYLDKNPAAREEWERTQKLAFDPRVTSIGCHLRKYSLDELPQLLNVFLGDMSLVGPRPMCPEQRDSYPSSEYFWMRPGMTGLWQVSARNMCSFAERAMYDSRYAGIMCFSTDLRILWKTASVVFRGTGI